MTLTRNQRKFSWTNRMSAFACCRFHNVNIIIHELFNFTTNNDKNIDSSKEGSDCDYAAVSSQEIRQQISPRSKSTCLFNLNIKPSVLVRFADALMACDRSIYSVRIYG